MNPYFRGAITVAKPKTKEEMYEVYTWQPLQGFKKKMYEVHGYEMLGNADEIFFFLKAMQKFKHENDQ
jgi:hypothetical protein